jgi:hypothetical protein
MLTSQLSRSVRFRRVATLTTALAMTLATTQALASEDTERETETETEQRDAEPPKAPAPHDDLLLTAGAGFFGHDQRGLGGSLGLTALRQKGWFAYGGTFEWSGVVFDYTSVTAAPMVGVFVEGPRWVRVGIAGVGGIHSYRGVGSGLLTSDPGASGTTAFVGTRVFFGAEVGDRARFHIGLQLSADDDLTRTRKTYSYEQTAGFGGAARSATATHTVGAFRYGAMLALGTAFDL